MDRILPYPVVVTAIVVAIAIFLLRKTQFGRHTYAIGGNMEAALRAGIPVDRRIIPLYMLSASTAGIAGFLSTLRFTAGSAVIGDPLLLSSIAAVIIGGVSLFGGAGTRHRHGDRLADHRRADDRPRHAQRRRPSGSSSSSARW